jgi:hypothetical protein
MVCIVRTRQSYALHTFTFKLLDGCDGQIGNFKLLVNLVGIEPTTSSMPFLVFAWSGATPTNCE